LLLPLLPLLLLQTGTWYYQIMDRKNEVPQALALRANNNMSKAKCV
jgi:hypothetical protein